MAEYIEREAALNASKIVYIEYLELDGEGYEEGGAEVIPVVFKKDIAVLPAADVKPVVRGEWITAKDKGDCCYRCSECGFMRDAYLLDVANFCPNCGADMRGKQ